MKNKYRKIVSIVSLFLCVVCSTACTAETKESSAVTPMTPEQSNAVSFNFIGGKDVMPLCGFHGPYQDKFNQDGNVAPNMVTDEYFQMVKDLGINMISASELDWYSTKEALTQALELGEKYGIGFFVGDKNLTWNYDITAEEAANYISEYYDYPAYCGLTLIDEPNIPTYNLDGNENRNLDLFVNLAKVLQYDLDQYCYINMYAIKEGNAKGYEVWSNYVKEVSDSLNQKIYSADMYPFDEKNQGLWQKYFYYLGTMRDYAIDHNAPFWGYIAAGAQWSGNYMAFDSVTPYFPNEPQFNWNVNTTLAYGAQGMQYFPLIQYMNMTPTLSGDGWDFNRNGIIGAWGNKTQWYHYVKNINTHIAEIDEVLMNSVHKGVIASGKQAQDDTKLTSCVIESGSFQELTSITGDALVGCFNYNGKTALYVVNHSMEYAQYITLNFNETQEIRKTQNAKTSYVKGDKLTLDMAAGEGVLVVIE